ncbi:hypothetical protein B5F89_05040 [Collinsella sp. An307]|nr:hypothetical protein B5F89_05040 [Collinsella sp. An307]
MHILYNIGMQSFMRRGIAMHAEPVRITASEFRQNFGTYMANVATTDYEVTRNGRVVGLWTNPNRDRVDAVRSLAGRFSAPGLDDKRVDELLLERRQNIAGGSDQTHWELA